MRSFILVVVTAFVLAVGALIYFWVQPHHGKAGSGKQASSTTHPMIRRSDSALGVSDGEHVSVKKYDQRTGELASEFISEEYTPRRGGLIDVKNAIARFYLAKGQIIELHGDTGTFRTDTPQQEGKRKGLTENRAGAPNRGQLKTVTVSILETIGPEDHRTTRPTMTITMDNAAFDSENATIVTEAYVDAKTGKTVAADQVPVAIRCPDTNPNGYDFDGRGMKMLWNERDHRLTSLDIVHGERLIIKNPKNINGSKPAPTNMAQSRVDVSHALPGVALASSDPHAVILFDEAPATPPAAARRRRRPTTTTAPAEAKPVVPVPATQPDSRRTTPRRQRPYVQQPPTIQKFTPNVEPPIYRAEFHENVRIVQNRLEMATADRMFVDFWMKSGGDEDAAATTQPGDTTQPAGRHHAATHPTTAVAATQPTTQQPPDAIWNLLRTGDATTRPFEAPRADQAWASAPATAPATQPTSRPADESPIYIYWTGPLHVAPHSEIALTEHTSIVTLEGAPVVATQQSSKILASRLIYRTEDGSLRAASMPNSQVTLLSTDAQKGNSTIHTTGLEYLAHAQPPTAILTGPSTAQLPTQGDGTMMNAAWNRRCVLQFTEGGKQIKEADLTGDVHVDHPQMKLDSQRLELSFAEAAGKGATKPAAQPTGASTKPGAGESELKLKQLTASNAVHCVMKGNDNKLTTIDGDRLTLLTDNDAEGKLTPRTVNVDGKVHTVDEDQDLTTDHLAITLAPTTKPASTKPARTQASATTMPATTQSSPFGGAVDLESLIAQGNVHTVDKKNNTQAFADTMLIDRKAGKTNVKLVGGQPGAKVMDKSSTVIGPIIDISSDEQTLAVDGGGEMIGSQQDAAGGTAKPMHVTWTRNMRIDGKQNVVNAFGDVHARTVESDGTVRIVSGEQAKLLLVDAPTTQPSTKPAKATTRVATTGPSTRPTTGPSEEPMAKKSIRQAIFTDDAQFRSELLDPDGLPVERMTLRSAILQYDVLPPTNGVQLPGQEPFKRITVPGPGKMLSENYRPAGSTTQPADGGPAGGVSDRGATAFQWDKSLVYDDESRRATMIGGVVIDHRDDVFKEDTMHITGETVVADIEPAAPAPPAPTKVATPTTGPATKPAAAPKVAVKNVVVRDHVHVTMKTGLLTADWIEYNPITRILIAHGTPETDAVFTRAITADPTSQPAKTKLAFGGTQPLHAQTMQWDAGADLPKITQGNATFRR